MAFFDLMTPRKWGAVCPKEKTCFDTVGEKTEKTDKFLLGLATWRATFSSWEQRLGCSRLKNLWGLFLPSVGGYTLSMSQLPQEWGCVCSESLPHFHAQSTLTCVCSKPIPSDATTSYLEDQVKKEQSFYLSDDRSFDGPDLVTPGASRLLGIFQAS